MNEEKYGLLLNKNIKLHRQYFKEMTKLIGINCVYRAPKSDKHWTTYDEVESNYQDPVVVSCIFEEHPQQSTMKKLGWIAELQSSASLISVPYDLEGIQVGALFIVPSAYDKTKGRLFRVSKLSTIMMYPASITCEIVPEYENTYSKQQEIYTDTSVTLLVEEPDNL